MVGGLVGEWGLYDRVRCMPHDMPHDTTCSVDESNIKVLFTF